MPTCCVETQATLMGHCPMRALFINVNARSAFSLCLHHPHLPAHSHRLGSDSLTPDGGGRPKSRRQTPVLQAGSQQQLC